MKTPEQIRDYVLARPNLTVRRLISDLFKHKVNAAMINAIRAQAGTPAAPANPSVVNRPRLKDLSEFRKEHDIPQKIRDRLAAMRADSYCTEEEFRQLCSVPVQLWRRNAELPEFSLNKFKHDGVTYWATCATIEKMKKITGRV